MIKDSEDILKEVINYLMEELELVGGGTISRLNFYINKKNEEKGDTLLGEVPNEECRFVFNQRQKDMKSFKTWIDIVVAENVELNSNFSTAAAEYAIAVDSLLYDDLSHDTFFKSIRMANVLKDIMNDYLKTKQEAGFMFGEIETNTLPDRVSADGCKMLRSGVTYLVVIQ